MVEMLVAVTILSVGALSIFSLQRTATREDRAADGGQTATALAAQLFEAARSLAYKDTRLAATTGFASPASTLSPANPLDANGESASSGFTRTWSITDDAPIPNVKTIAVRVAWTQNGEPRRITITSLKAK